MAHPKTLANGHGFYSRPGGSVAAREQNFLSIIGLS
jgi:hypothetical protein